MKAPSDSSMLYEGKAKKIHTVSDQLWQSLKTKTQNTQVMADKVRLVEYKDSLTAFNAVKKGSFEQKGNLNRDITTLIFQYLQGHGIRTHWLGNFEDTGMLVESLQIVPLEVVVRNRWAGFLAKKLGREEGPNLPQPLVEFYLKDDALGDPFMSEDQITVLGYADQATIQNLKKQALLINGHLLELMNKAGLSLVDFKMEFGRNSSGDLILGDEISPDTCRLWDLRTEKKLDKDRFRRDLGGVEEAYREVLERLKGALG